MWSQSHCWFYFFTCSRSIYIFLLKSILVNLFAKVKQCDFQAHVIIDIIMASFLLNLGSLTLNEATCYIMRTCNQLCEEVYELKNWDLLPTTVWANLHGDQTSSHSQAFRWLQCQPTSWLVPYDKCNYSYTAKLLWYIWPIELVK